MVLTSLSSLVQLRTLFIWVPLFPLCHTLDFLHLTPTLGSHPWSLSCYLCWHLKLHPSDPNPIPTPDFAPFSYPSCSQSPTHISLQCQLWNTLDLCSNLQNLTPDVIHVPILLTQTIGTLSRFSNPKSRPQKIGARYSAQAEAKTSSQTTPLSPSRNTQLNTELDFTFSFGIALFQRGDSELHT